jgi:hypothetical protein
MTDLTDRQLLDAILRGIEETGRRFASATAKRARSQAAHVRKPAVARKRKANGRRPRKPAKA